MARLQLLIVIALFHACCIKAIAVTDNDYYSQANAAISNNHYTRAASILRQHLQQQPDDIQARFLLARVLSWQQQWTESMVLFDGLLKEKPDNSDFLLARANTLEWLGRRDDALRDLKKARRLSPDYSEIWRTEIKYLRRKKTPDADAQAIRLAEAAKQKFPQESWQRLLITTETKIVKTNSYAVQASYGYDKLTNNRAPWEMTSLNFFMQTSDKRFANLQLNQAKRFDLEDWQIGGSYALPLTKTWYLYAGANYSPTHKVLANRTLETKISRSFSSGLNLHVGVSHAKYSQTDSRQLYLTGEYYWSVYRASYSFRLIDVKNAGTGNNNNIQLNRYYDSASFIGAVMAKGEDVEFDGTANPPISDVLTLSLYGNHYFKPQWSLIYTLTYHQQGDFYNRNGFVLGLKYDF